MKNSERKPQSDICDLPPLLLSSGDPSGIGLEIAFKAWLQRKQQNIPAFTLIADPQLAQKRANFLHLNIDFITSDPRQDRKNFANFLPIMPLKNQQIDQIGTPHQQNAAGIIEALSLALEKIKNHEGLALVTCPISKQNLYETGFTYAGHTEFLAAKAQEIFAPLAPTHPVMMLAGCELKTVPVTIHIPLREVAQQLSTDKIIRCAEIVHHALKTDFQIDHPRLVITGLNPHAGENGHLGDEEERILKPALQKLMQNDIKIAGPFPADTLFHPQKRNTYDAALCMYHDQALIPIKTIHFDTAVNVTLGLPFIRTSPDHGTAFDIAAKNCASPNSLIAALQLAQDLALNRRKSFHGRD